MSRLVEGEIKAHLMGSMDCVLERNTEARKLRKLEGNRVTYVFKPYSSAKLSQELKSWEQF